MQITVDDETFHKWAAERGYVRLTDISDFFNRKFTSVVVSEVDPPNGEPPVVYVKEFDTPMISPQMTSFPFFQMRADQLAGNNFTDQVTALDTPLDAPVTPFVYHQRLAEPTDKELTDALTSVLTTRGKEAAIQLLADFDTTSVRRLPPGRAREFMIAAGKVLEP